VTTAHAKSRQSTSHGVSVEYCTVHFRGAHVGRGYETSKKVDDGLIERWKTARMLKTVVDGAKAIEQQMRSSESSSKQRSGLRDAKDCQVTIVLFIA